MVLMQQLPLFGDDARVDGTSNNGSGFQDPAFATNKTLPIHRWVPWVAGFSRDFVADVLQRYLPQTGLVLDPFAGVGTTLVEALLHGHQAVGFEINPYAALASQVKSTAYSLEPACVRETLAKLQRFHVGKMASSEQPRSVMPTGFKTRAAFYSPKVLRKVLFLQDFIETLDDEALRALFQLAFAATMVQYSNYSYEPSLGRRVSAGKAEIEDYPVCETVVAKLQVMALDIEWFRSQQGVSKVKAQVINDTFFNCQRYLGPETVDILITSPPYLNNYHYNRNTRPQLYWLGFVERPKDLHPLEHQNFGKYWQTVRGEDPLQLDFSLPGSDLESQLEILRARHPEKGIYGGAGWANYAVSYFNDCYRFAQVVTRVLKPGGTALVVVGNSILQGLLIPTDHYLGQIAELAGLKLVGIEIPRATRVGNSIIQSDVRVRKAKDSHQLYEAIVELRKI